ncbi:DNRLRE domain-containing protein [Streptomyces murinus]|uniref:DNRLRE domain-containing protein n=1 Tax=Streptomyces murinus TaxID=33900 RepID=UPI0036E37E98
MSLALTVTLLDGAYAAAASAPPSSKAPKKAAATQAADIPSARVAARLSGRRVEALSERTETSTTWVNKDGSLTTELSAGPIRFKDKATGQWRNVDVNLVRNADGSVEPKAHPRGLRLAGRSGTPAKSMKAARTAKATDLVTLGEGDQQITLQWKGGLPKPKLDGTRADYVNAIPGADVVIEATRTGFEQYVQIKRRPDTGGYSYTLPLKAKGLKAKQLSDGSVLFTDKKNKKRAVMPAPVMWDATVDKRSGEHTHKARVGLKVAQKGSSIDLVVTPDAKFLADPDTTYPVTVDPSTSSLSNVFDTYVQQGETVDWSTDTELDLGNPGTKNADGTPRTARSFVSWDTTPIRDALVQSATLSLWNFHSANTDCQLYPWEVWSTGAASTSSRWTAQPSWTAKKATSTETTGNPGCSAQPDGWINADVSTLVQEWASAKVTRGDMGLRASDESVMEQWKRVNSANAASNPPKLVVNYNYRPRTGTDRQAGPPFSKDSNGTWYVNTTTPTLRDTFTDADGDKVDGTFEIDDAATNTQVGNYLVSPYVPSGQPATVTVPSGLLTNGKTYKFRTNPYDGTHYNTAWSAWETFTVDTSAPSAPTSVTSTDYPTGQWVKGAGKAGTFTVTPPGGDQNGIEWSLDGTTWTKVNTGGTTSPVSFSVTPDKAGTNTLQVRATDQAENKSEAVSYTFHVGPGGVTSPDDGTRTAARVPLTAEADGSKYDHVSFSWRRGDADTWAPIPAGDVTDGGQPLTSWPVSLSSGKSPSLTWNATSTVTPDGTVQVRADFTGPNNASTSSDPITVVVDRTADGAASQDVGPGSLNLLTGDYALSATDASVFGMTVTRTASSRSPQAGGNQDGQVPIFGKEWTSGVVAEPTSSHYTEIRKTSDHSLDIATADGDTIQFTANADSTGWVPEPGSENLTLKGSFSSGDFTLTDTNGTVTTFSKVDPAATTWTVTSSLTDGLANSTTKVVSEAVTSGGKTLARPKRIITSTTATTLATCDTDPSTKGCRVMEFAYPTTTTATSSAFGDFAGQVSQVKVWSTAPGASTATEVAVAQYRYDDQGRLRESWDPRISPALKTAFTYDSAGRVTTLTPPGQLPWAFTYGTAGSNPAAGDGMLLSVSRPTLTPGSADQTDGTATTSVVYGVPLTGSAAPQNLGASAAATWGQSDLPTDATAVFPPDQVPASHNGTDLAAADYTRAGIHYLDASAREVDEATPGHHISVTEYDQFGNTVRSLTAGNRELALGTTQAQKNQLTDLGINALSTGERAQLLSSTSVYGSDGQRETDSYSPLHQITLAVDLVSGTTTLAPAGSRVIARQHTTMEYDTGRPTDGTATVKNEITKQTVGAQVRSWPDLLADPRVSTTGYDWVKGLPTQTVTDPSGLALTKTTSYDSQGRVTKTTLPKSSGSDAGATVTTYYSATGTGACNGKPEWADLVCSTGPAGDITGGGSNPTQLPTKTIQYDRWGNAAKATETANSVTRTTTVTYDDADRLTTTSVSGGLGTAVPDSTTTYDTSTGQVATVTSNGQTITHTYDKLGREISYNDGAGNTADTQYDALGRMTETTDSTPSTTTYSYDTSKDPRGVETSRTDSVAGAFAATYDADGELATESLPGGYTLTVGKDETGAETSRVYSRDSDGTVIASDITGENIHGQVLSDADMAGQSRSRTYRYDATGRLTRADDTDPSAACTRRDYTFDDNTNRTALAVATSDVGAACTSTGATTTSYSYDSADRLVTSGTVYDALGRTTTQASGATIGYYANDLVHQQTSGGTTRQTWSLDAAGRLAAWTSETNSNGTWTQTGSRTNHYGSDTDSPDWTQETSNTITRYVRGIGGDLDATTNASGDTVLQLTDMHGAVTVQLPLDTAQAPIAYSYDEYGNPEADTIATRYGWLGGNQRSSETITGATLMGVRLYDPTIGRFLQTDPVPEGSANAYDYANADPINNLDLTGTSSRNYNGHHWHWWGLEIDMTRSRAMQVADRMNANAGKAAILAALFGAIPGSNVGAVVLGAISGLYWWLSGKIYTMLNEYRWGVKINIEFGYPGVTHE